VICYRIINKAGAPGTKQVEIAPGASSAFTMPFEYYCTAPTLADASAATFPEDVHTLWYEGCMSQAIAWDPERRTESRERMKAWRKMLAMHPNEDVEIPREARDVEHLYAGLASRRGNFL